MPESKRPDPKRRSPASRPGRAGDSTPGRPRKSPAARQGPNASRALPEAVEPIKRAIVESAEQRSEQRLGLTARRRSEEHTSELQSLTGISYAGLCLKKKKMWKS